MQILSCLAPFSTYHLMPREKSKLIDSCFGDGGNQTWAAIEYSIHHSIASQQLPMGVVAPVQDCFLQFCTAFIKSCLHKICVSDDKT